MSLAREHLIQYQNDRTLFYGCPLPPDELQEVQIGDEVAKAIRPSVPMSYNFETGLFEPHDSVPVVCACASAEVVVFHALVRAAALRLPLYARRNGWTVDNAGNVSRVQTTQILNDYVEEQGGDVKAYVYRLAKTSPPFELRLQGDAFEWRSREPVKWLGEPVEVSGRDWPRHIVDIVPPYKQVQYPSHDSSARKYQKAPSVAIDS